VAGLEGEDGGLEGEDGLLRRHCGGMPTQAGS
jgi:hypothetical protein